MKKLPLFTAFLTVVIALVGGVVYYLNAPASGLSAPAPVSEKADLLPASNAASKEGAMEVVMTPPKTFNGLLSPEASSPEEFSSNPKRDPSEQGVLDLVAVKGLTDHAKVERLLAMIPTLPPDAQTLAMENATTLIPDAEYLNRRNQLLQLARSPEMRVAVMNDSLTRGEEIRLPNLLEMMRTSTSEAEKQEIREIFEAYLDKDYGPHPAQWEGPLRKWVAENTQ
jgi:hypothetical protein